MLNINDKMDHVEDMVESDKVEEVTQNKFEFDNSNYKVNYFGIGRGAEDLQ